MLSLYRKFATDAATAKSPRIMTFPGCEIYSGQNNDLICRMDQREFVIATDVYVYYADSEAIWYSLCSDLSKGLDLVYRIDTHSLDDCKKGIIDDDLRFFYTKNGYLYVDDENGQPTRLFPLKTIDYLSNLYGKANKFNLENIEGLFATDLTAYSETDFYRDLQRAHLFLGLIGSEHDAKMQSSAAAATVITDVIKMCCKSEMDIFIPLQKRLKEKMK